MAQWHLNEVQNGLEQIEWNIVSREAGDDYSISETWVLKRSSILYLDFSGLDDMNTLSIEDSYGCLVRDSELGLYFYKKGEKWKNSLRTFLLGLNKL